jgi:hypothetical protein
MRGKKSIIFFVFLSCLIFIVDCDISDKLSQQLAKFTSKEADKLARDYIDSLLKADIERAEDFLDPRIITMKTRSGLQKCSEKLNKENLISIEMIGLTVLRNTRDKNKTIDVLTYQLEFKNMWYILIVSVVDISGNLKIGRFQVDRAPKLLARVNAFTFLGKSFHHYIVLLIAICIPIFIICMIVLCIRTKMKRKWLWIIYMLFGFCKYSINWTNGQTILQLCYIQLFSADISKRAPYAPWVISFSVPFGALLFLLKRHRIKKKELANASMVTDSSDVVTEEVDS